MKGVTRPRAQAAGSHRELKQSLSGRPPCRHPGFEPWSQNREKVHCCSELPQLLSLVRAALALAREPCPPPSPALPCSSNTPLPLPEAGSALGMSPSCLLPRDTARTPWQNNRNERSQMGGRLSPSVARGGSVPGPQGILSWGRFPQSRNFLKAGFPGLRPVQRGRASRWGWRDTWQSREQGGRWEVARLVP